MKKIVFVVVFTVGFYICLLFYTSSTIKLKSSEIFTHIVEEPLINTSGYLVNRPKCKILNVDPFHSQVKKYYHKEIYRACIEKELLTYVTKEDNVATLHINPEAQRSYRKENISCCYSKIIRVQDRKKQDNTIKYSSCTDFHNNVSLENEFIKVTCKSPHGRKPIYENTHAPITITEEVKEKFKLTKNKNKAFSVLIIGIDSISRLNFIRSLPNSYRFLMDNEWISFMGYNKVDDNTYPNVMAILTGDNQDEKQRCKYDRESGLNDCEMIWYDYGNAGYVTAYAEDETRLGTFNLYKKGFKNPPTDYYFRPYFLASEKLEVGKFSGMAYCTGPETSGERVLNIAKDFATTFTNHPNFALFWMNTFSHNYLNAVSMMDDKIKIFLQDISNEGVLENSFVLFLSDHGFRFGNFRHTSMGWLEERLPFFFLWVPHRFRRSFKEEYANLRNNARKLTSPFDVYITLQHLLILSEFSYEMKESFDCPKCASLFEKIENDRSCEDAGIGPHWCTCMDFQDVKSNEIVQEAALFTLHHIENVIITKGQSQKCAEFSLHQVLSANVSSKYILIVMETKPKAIFEVTLQHTPNNTQTFKLNGISRIDSYAEHSFCVQDSFLVKICYCKEEKRG